MRLPIGTLLHSGTYRIVSVLGQGSFGITYLAEHVNLGKKVAIKEFFMKELNSRDEDGSITGMSDGSLSLNYFKKFKKEAINLSNLDHPNIVRVTDSFGENGTFYYVMDFIEGQNLNDYVKQHSLSTDESISIICSVADALIYMHEQKHMLHLDLKPSNVMRRANDGHIFLIDFGLSKHYSEDGTPDTSTNIGLGTAGYAPIEQGNKSKDGEFRPTIDVYALGATFYKLLTGETPPVASDLLNNNESLPNNLKAKGVSEALLAVVEKTMNPIVIGRYQSICELKNAILSVDVRGASKGYSKEVTKQSDEDTIVVNPFQSPPSPSILKFSVHRVSFEMVKVEAGTFTMGATSEQANPDADEKPTHRVTLTKDYYIGKTEVTQALWKAVMGSNPSHFNGDNKPVEEVSWNDCQTFISKLNSMTGKKFRLPTEAEWEFAARGGNYSRCYQYSGSNSLNDVAWFTDNSGSTTHDVATKLPNELGLYDMSGNVWEWCSDWYGSYSSNAQYDPVGPLSGSYRVRRGGSWGSFARRCRSSFRDGIYPGNGGSYLGLRLVLSDSELKGAFTSFSPEISFHQYYV